MTGGTINTPAPAITATVPTTAHKRPTHRGIRKRRSSWSVIAEKYTAARTARKTRMRTSATRRTNQMTRAAMKRSEEHTSELQSRLHLVCRLLLEKKKAKYKEKIIDDTYV